MHPLDSGWWEAHNLPLIVAATEVGYRYRGSGTDFWPVLAEELGSHIGGPARQRIRDLFAAAVRAFRGAHPPATRWAEAFHLIAWPITHALVPIEFHRPLALTLANLRVSVAESDDESLHRAIRVAAVSSSARFSTLLEDASLVVPVAKNLLGAGTGELCHETTQRIAADLAADEVARRSVAAARRVQRAASAGVQARTKKDKPIATVKGTLRLRRRDEALTLEASFPPIDARLASRLRRVLRRRRYAPRLWGVTARIPSAQLLSGLPFALKLSSAPADDSALLPGLEELDIDDDLQETLGAFDLQVAAPLLFAVGADNEVARLVRGPSISGHRTYWALTAVVPPSVARFPILGDVGPYTCHALDPAEEGACQALSDLGFVVRFGVSVAFAGAPPLDRDASTPVFVAGEQRIIAPRHSYPEGVLVELDGCAAHASGDEAVRVVVPEGEHLLRVSSGTASREFAFMGVSTPELPSTGVCSVAARSSELTVQALLSGRLAFAVESFAPLEGLELTVEIEAAERRLSASAPLGPLPQTITSEVEPFTSLLDDATRELLLQAPCPAVHLRVGSLCASSWALEQPVRPCWWVRGPDGHVALMSELGEMQFGEVTATAPHLPPVSESDPSPLEARLLAPVELDISEYGGAALFTTLCVAPTRARLEAPAVRKPRLVRRRRAERDAAGLEDLVEAYLRWSLAETDTLIAEMRRRQIAGEIDAWIAEMCCGEVWARHESDLSGADPWALLVDICLETGLGRDSYVELSPEEDREVTRLAVAEIRRVQPELWTRVGPPCDLSAEDYEALDLACGRAYSELARQYRKRGREEQAAEIEDGDPGAAADEWDKALERVKAQAELRPLAALLLPSDSARTLMALDTSVMILDELAEELAGWARDARRAFAGDVPPAEVLEAILALWAEPEVAVGLDWRGALDTLIVERSVARAARYLALSTRQARRGGAA